MTWLATATIYLMVGYLLALSVLALARPSTARSFLHAHASSARAHLLEMTLRLIVGAALIVASAEMRYPEAFRLIGWILVVSAIVLLVIPWRFHHWIAGRVLPPVTRRMGVFAIGAAAMGLFLLYALIA